MNKIKANYGSGVSRLLNLVGQNGARSAPKILGSLIFMMGGVIDNKLHSALYG